MDPQNRVLLEQAVVALADAAACAGASLAGTKTGVYVGCMYQEYMQVPWFAVSKHAEHATGGMLQTASRYIRVWAWEPPRCADSVMTLPSTSIGRTHAQPSDDQQSRRNSTAPSCRALHVWTLHLTFLLLHSRCTTT